MSKTRDSKKQNKKTPLKTAKEKKLAKQKCSGFGKKDRGKNYD